MRSDAPLITCFAATNAEQVALSPGGGCKRPPARCCTQRLVRLTSKILQITSVWSARGAEFLTPPMDHGAEIRCYMRGPDGYLIEVGEATGILNMFTE